MLAFVTVGTTKFDSLIDRICDKDTLNTLFDQGYVKLRIQYGPLGRVPRLENAKREKRRKNASYVLSDRKSIEIEWFPIKSSIKKDLEEASLVIGHAGAGTILETLRAGTNLVVVTNPDLMDDHQTDLANAMQREEYLLQATCKTLTNVLTKLKRIKLKQYPAFDPKPFINMCDEELGLR